MTDATAATENAVEQAKAAPIAELAKAGERIYEAFTGGKNAGEHQALVDGTASLLDTAMPTVESKVPFDLAGVIAGITGIAMGIATVVLGFKAKKAKAETEQEQPKEGAPQLENNQQ